MDDRRKILLSKLEEAAATAAPERLEADGKVICFQILYGLPREFQIRAACFMMQRYLPIFEEKMPGVSWPRRLLEDVDEWARTELGVPESPDGADAADLGYALTFACLLTANSYRDEPVCLTAETCGILEDAASTRARHVWLADDPEAARLKREVRAYFVMMANDLEPDEPTALFDELESPAHSPYHNAAYIAVYRREWGIIASWLRAEAVWQYPEPEDLDAMMEGLKRWQAIHLYNHAGPTLAGLGAEWGLTE